MSRNTGTLIGAPLKQIDSDDQYPVAHANDIKGGLHSAATFGERNAIPVWLRDWGMMCYVQGEGMYLLEYAAGAAITDNTKWVKLTIGAGPQPQPYPTPESFFPFYKVMDSSVNLTPLVGEGKTLVTHTGSTPIFSQDYVTNNVEFLAFRAHKNPLTPPIANTPNGNYWPGLVTCRYSKVVEYIDGYNVKVDFVYNGGNLATPQATTAASGYFFVDTKGYISEMLQSNGSLQLEDGKTYVVKGGLNLNVDKHMHLYSAGSSALKLSIEDAFANNATFNGTEYGTANSYANTFGSYKMFTINVNTDFDVNIENVDILPPTYNVANTQYSRGYCDPFFLQPSGNFAGIGDFCTGQKRIFNSNGRKEADMYSFPNQTNLLPVFAVSLDGGKVTGTDNSKLQEWVLEQTTWETTEFANIRDNTRVGNKLILKGTVSNPTQTLCSDKLSKGVYLGRNIRLTNTTHWTNLQLLDDDISMHQLTTDTWYGTQGHNMEAFYNDRRSVHIDVTVGANKWKLYGSNKGSFAEDYAAGRLANTNQGGGIPSWNWYNALDARNLYLKERIPVVGETIVITGFNEKVSNTKFIIEDYQFQATQTFPFVDGTQNNTNLFEGIYTSPDNDQLEYWNGLTWQTISILKRERLSRNVTAITAAIKKLRWKYTFDIAIPEANPTFRVKKSICEAVLNSDIVADLIFPINGNYTASSADPVVNNYWMYGTNTTNFDFENVVIRGFWRGATNENVPQNTQTLATLYNLTKGCRFVNVNHVNGQGGYSLARGRGVYFRNLLTGATNKVLVQNSNIQAVQSVGYNPLQIV